jgi:hypothetical protein
MHGLVTEADHPLQVIQRPAGIEGVTLVAGIGTDRRIAFLKYAIAQCRVDDKTDKPATAAEYELAIPVVGADSSVTEVILTSGRFRSDSRLQF